MWDFLLLLWSIFNKNHRPHLLILSHFPSSHGPEFSGSDRTGLLRTWFGPVRGPYIGPAKSPIIYLARRRSRRRRWRRHRTAAIYIYQA
jgi:hypothetical protein